MTIANAGKNVLKIALAVVKKAILAIVMNKIAIAKNNNATVAKNIFLSSLKNANATVNNFYFGVDSYIKVGVYPPKNN